jgi:D-alanyl-D-alanine carboxypeptidase
VHRDKRFVVAVVLGGSSASSRDARMRQLLNTHLAAASTKRTAPMIAEAAPKAEPKSAQRTASVAGAQKDSQRFSLASASAAAAELDEPPAAAAAVPGSTDPIRPVLVKTLNVKPSGVQTASAAPLPFAGLPRAAEAARADPAPAATAEPPPAPATPPAPPGAAPGVLGTLTVRTAAVPAVEPTPAVTAAPAAPTVTATAVATTTAATTPVAAVAKQPVRTGWIIQVGAYPDEDTAKQRLTTAMDKASRLLAKADPFTEPTVKDGTTYYRARFAGLNKDQAEAACKLLKRNDVDCMAIKN